MGYTKGTDGTWYSNYVSEAHADNVAVTGILSVLANKKINELNPSTIDQIKVGQVLGYKYATDAWYDQTNTKVTGVLASLSDLTVGNLSNADLVLEKLRGITLAEAMGYTKGTDGTWYSKYVAEGHADNVKLSGILKLLADKKLNAITSDTIDDILLGDVIGYSYNDNKWYDESEKEVKGMMAMVADLTVGELSNSNALATKLRSLTLADAMGYEQKADGWYNGNQKIAGILQALATKPLNKIDSEINDIKLGQALGYTYNQSESKWYDGNTAATGIMVNFANLSIKELQNPTTVTQTLNQMQLSDVLGYTNNGTSWVKDGHVASGVMAHLMDIKIENIEHEIDEMPLGYAFGFYYDNANGKWYTDKEHTVEPTGVTAALANIHLTHAREEFESMKIGTFLGYELGNDDKWYSNGVELKDGLILIFADMVLADLNDTHKISVAMQKATIGDSLGLMKHTDGKWYHTKTVNSEIVIDLTSPVNSSLNALADSTIGNIETAVQTIEIGTMLNFTYNSDDEKWYDGENAVTGVLAAIADADMNTLGSTINNLKIKDVFEDRSGWLAAIDANRPVSELGDAINDCTMHDLISNNVITIDPAKKAALDMMLNNPGNPDYAWEKEYTVIDLLNYFLNGTKKDS
jgi:hypothetical protein